MNRRTAARRTLALACRTLAAASLESQRTAKLFADAREAKKRAESAFRSALAHAIERKAL